MKTIGVIGLGSIGMRHAKNLKDMGHKVIGYDPLQSIAWAPQAPILSDVLAVADAVVVASPTALHLEQFKYYLEETKKPIFMEKPIADEYAREMGVVRMVGYNLRFHVCVKQARDLLEKGAIGSPIWANFTCAQFNDKPAYLRGGVILNWSHEIDLALYLLGDATVVTSSTLCTGGLNDGHDLMTDIILSHQDKCRSTVHLDYLTKPERRGFIIVGTEGTITANLSPHRSITVNGKQTRFTPNAHNYDQDYIEEMSAFLRRIDGEETLGCTGEEALKVLEICLEVRKRAGLG